MKKILALLRRFLPCLIVLAIAGCIFIAGNIVSGISEDALSKVNREIQDLSSESDRLNRKYEELSSTTGVVSVLDTGRVNEDDERIKALLDRSADWSNNAEYTEIRNDVIRTHGRAVDGFISVFLPDGVSVSFKRYAVSDFVSHLSFENFTSHLIRVSNNNYSYMAEVLVKCSSANGAPSVDVPVVLFYTIDGTGKFVNVDAYVVED